MPMPTIEDRLAITDGVNRFFRLVDTGHAAQTAALFTRDATLTFGPGSPNPGTISGEAIAAAMKAREAQTSAFTRHAVTNVAVTGSDGPDAQVSYLLTLYRSDDETRSSVPAFVADVEETWAREDGEWRIAARTILPAFARTQ